MHQIAAVVVIASLLGLADSVRGARVIAAEATAGPLIHTEDVARFYRVYASADQPGRECHAAFCDRTTELAVQSNHGRRYRERPPVLAGRNGARQWHRAACVSLAPLRRTSQCHERGTLRIPQALDNSWLIDHQWATTIVWFRAHALVDTALANRAHWQCERALRSGELRKLGAHT
jgi:hypothetical protein